MLAAVTMFSCGAIGVILIFAWACLALSIREGRTGEKKRDTVAYGA